MKGWILFGVLLVAVVPMKADSLREGVLIPDMQRIGTAPQLTDRSVADQWPRGVGKASLWASFVARAAECGTQEIGFAVAGAYGHAKAARVRSCALGMGLVLATQALVSRAFRGDADAALWPMAAWGTYGTVNNVRLIRKIQQIKAGR